MSFQEHVSSLSDFTQFPIELILRIMFIISSHVIDTVARHSKTAVTGFASESVINMNVRFPLWALPLAALTSP